MKKTLLLTGLMASLPLWAAESSVLKDIMGESVYEQSGITELDEQQLRVLETWILNNAVEKRVVQQAPAATPEKPVNPVDMPATPKLETATEPSVNAQAASSGTQVPAHEPAEVVDSEPRYVRLAEEPIEAEAAEEEPVTQKYVRIDSLQEKDRNVEPDLIRSRIDGTFRGWKNNKTRFRLENGEIWEQRQSSTYITNLESPEVIIRKRRFGYTMEVPAVGRKVHVRRIK